MTYFSFYLDTQILEVFPIEQIQIFLLHSKDGMPKD